MSCPSSILPSWLTSAVDKDLLEPLPRHSLTPLPRYLPHLRSEYPAITLPWPTLAVPRSGSSELIRDCRSSLTYGSTRTDLLGYRQASIYISKFIQSIVSFTHGSKRFKDTELPQSVSRSACRWLFSCWSSPLARISHRCIKTVYTLDPNHFTSG